MGRPDKVSPTTSIVPDPADCVCGCCAQLLKALAAIRLELHRLNERVSQIDSESAGWPA